MASQHLTLDLVTAQNILTPAVETYLLWLLLLIPDCFAGYQGDL
jgi:hypothetical protein